MHADMCAEMSGVVSPASGPAWQALDVPSEVITLSVPALAAFSAVTGAGIAALGSRLGWTNGQIGVLHEAVETAFRPVVTKSATTSNAVTLHITVNNDGRVVNGVDIEVTHDGSPLNRTDRRAVHDSLVERVDLVEVRPNGKSIAFTFDPKR